jgi:hypothetical protein
MDVEQNKFGVSIIITTLVHGKLVGTTVPNTYRILNFYFFNFILSNSIHQIKG